MLVAARESLSMYVRHVVWYSRKETRRTQISKDYEGSRIDFVIFIVNITNMNSFEEIRNYLDSDDFDFNFPLFNRCCMVVTHGNNFFLLISFSWKTFQICHIQGGTRAIEWKAPSSINIRKLAGCLYFFNLKLSKNKTEGSSVLNKVIRQYDAATQKTVCNALVLGALSVTLEADVLM